MFVGPYGKTPARPNFSTVWRRAITAADLPGLHFHDLRHTGNHFATMSGASTRELMGRMGHVSVDAALVYQHRTASRDRAIADALDRMVSGWAATAAGPSTSSGHEIGGPSTGLGHESSGHVGGTPLV